MSAIAGIVRFDGREDTAEDCARMLGAQKIYGPHDTAQWDGGFIALGRDLFRLLPEDVHDHQPLHGAGGTLSLVADLRLDNRDELLPLLGISPERGRELADAAILLAAFRRWGEGCLDRIVGDFAFALWNAAQRRLLLVRDPLGQRPLYYHRAPGMLAFASMAKGLHALPEIARAPDEDRVAEFVVLMPDQGPRTFFAGISRVEPGHVVSVTAAGISTRRYWEPARKPIRLANQGAYAEGLRHHMDVATRARLRGLGADVGAHLSAGLDSSIVATTAARALSSRGGNLVAFTAVPRKGYPAPPGGRQIVDEGGHAAATAAMHPNIDHVLVHGDGRSPLADLERYFYLFEQPITNLCNGAWVDAINDAARARRLNVMLAGFMGNMTISYDGIEALPQYLCGGHVLRWAREAAALVRSGQMNWESVLGKSIGPFVPPPLWTWLNRKIKKTDLHVTGYSAINPQRLRELGLAARARGRDLDFSYRPRRDGFAARLWALRRIDMGNFHKGTLAGWGIDQRDPTTDRRLVEFCLNLPADVFLSRGVTRALARHAFTDRVPALVLDEQRRGLQGADWHENLNTARAQIAAEVAHMDESAPAARALDMARLKSLTENWPQQGWDSNRVVIPYRLALLRAIATGHFLRKAGGANR